MTPIAAHPEAGSALANALLQTCAELEQARGLPAAVFTAADIHALEARELFGRSWLAVARASDLPDAGSFVTHDVAGERVLIVRGEDRVLRAFYNVCRHRGSRLVDAPSGRFRSAIACPYHAWSYAFDGRLRQAPNMAAVSDGGDRLALGALPLATRDGFVCVNLDPAAPPLAHAHADAPDLARFGLDALVCVRSLEYAIGANWKIVCQNYSECYHCPGVHPQLNRLSALSGGGFESGACFNGGPMRLREGVDTLSMSGRTTWPRLSRDGAADATLVHYYLLYPNLMLGIHPDYLLTHRVWPLEAARSRIVCELWVPPECVAAADFDPSGVIEFWDTTNRQDWALCEGVQHGAASRGYRPGPYHPSERCVHAFDRWYAQWLTALEHVA